MNNFLVSEAFSFDVLGVCRSWMCSNTSENEDFEGFEVVEISSEAFSSEFLGGTSYLR